MPDTRRAPRLPARRSARTLTAALAVALTGGAALTACAPSTGATGGSTPVAATVPAPVPTDQLRNVTLKVGDQKGGGTLKALLAASGQDQGTPYRIEWATFTSGPPLLEAAAAGAVDFGGVGNTPPIFAGAAGSPLSIVAASRDEARGDTILVPKGSTLRQVSDLRGRTVAVAKGSSAHGHLALQLRTAGLSTSDVKIAFVAPSDAYAALAAGRVDAWAVWDHYSAQAVQELGARVLADGHGVANGLGFQVASRSALADAKKNSAIADLVQRTTRARLWATKHPQEWAKIYTAATGVPYAVSLTAAKRSEDDPVPLTDEVIASEQTLVDALAAEKVIPRQFTFADLVDRRYDAEVTATIARDSQASDAPTADAPTADASTGARQTTTTSTQKG